MFPFLPTAQDVSICLRCQYRLAARRSRRRKPFDGAQDLFLRRFIALGQNAAQERVQTDDTVIHKSHETPRERVARPSKSGPISWRQANLHNKDPLGFDALGEPVEIITMQNELQQALMKRQETTYGKAITFDNPASSDELLASIDAERTNISSDLVRENIENLKDTWVSSLRDRFDPPTPSEVEDLTRKLRDSFTGDQLLNYFHDASSSDSLEIDYDFSSELYKWSAWTPGTTPFPASALSRLRSLKGMSKDPYTTSQGQFSANRTRRRPVKQIVIGKIMRQLWHIQTEQEKDSLGELDVWIQAEHLDLILNHRRDMLKRLSEVYGSKVEASRSIGVIRITADRDTTSDVLKLLKFILENIKKAEVDLLTSGQPTAESTAALRDVLNKALLEQIEQLTSTVIRTSRLISPEKYQSELIVHYLGPSDGDLEDVRRLILQALEPAALKETKIHMDRPPTEEKVILVPVEVGTALPLNERGTEWSRWRTGMNRKSPSESALTRGRRSKNLTGTIASTHQFLFRRVQKKESTARHIPGNSESCWDKDLRQKTSVVFGQVLYPAKSTASENNYHKVKSGREFLTTIPGLREFLRDLPSQHMFRQEQLFIRLTPTRWSGSQGNPTNDLPDLEIRISIDTENRTVGLHSVKLIVGETQSDVLLPDEATDLRFLAETHLPTGKQVDQRIRDFIEASNLNIWGQDRLKTPARLQLMIPPHALRSRIGNSKPVVIPDSEIQVDYVFAGLSHQSFFRVPYPEFELEYSIIEAGRTGGRRDELRISLPEQNQIVHNQEQFTAFFTAAHVLAQNLKQTQPQRFGGITVRRRYELKRVHTSKRPRRLVRRTRPQLNKLLNRVS